MSLVSRRPFYGLVHRLKENTNTVATRPKETLLKKSCAFSPEEEEKLYEALRQKTDFSPDKRYELYGMANILTFLSALPSVSPRLKNEADIFKRHIKNGVCEDYWQRYKQNGRVLFSVLQGAPPLLHLKIGCLQKSPSGAGAFLTLYDGVSPKFTDRFGKAHVYPVRYPVKCGAERALLRSALDTSENFTPVTISAVAGNMPSDLTAFLETDKAEPLHKKKFPPQKDDDCFFHAPLFALLRENPA